MSSSLESVQLVSNGISDKIINKYSKVEKRRLSIAISLLRETPKYVLITFVESMLL